MAFGTDLPASARRHLEAANHLLTQHPDVAGYLFGITTEYAIKAMMLDAGLRPKTSEQKREDPFFAHFPGLRTMLRDTQLGRQGKPLMDYIENDAFMQNWSTDMRYSHGREIRSNWIEAWAEQARQAVASIGT
ncbi:MAG: hypothetical protein F9K30_23660 [Dechloromonas sp.]|nr:MAG: hypothetical protein F9K30_23660 [Dechloromonas sp.]